MLYQNYKMKSIKFLGTRIDAITMQETLDSIERFINSGKPHQHVVVNVAKIVNMQKDKELRESVIGADIINADGMGIIWGTKFLGKKLPERVTGIDLFDNLLKISQKKGYKLYFLGAKQEILNIMIKNIKKKYPKIKIVGFRNGYFNDYEEQKIVKNIKKSKAQVLFVGISSPKKERFIKKYLNCTNVSFAMGVGGSFDIFAGKTKRAPFWMQKAGLEWIYRIIQEPKRMFKRYLLTNSKFLLLLLKEKFK